MESERCSADLERRLLGHLERIAHPRHALWDPVGHLAARTYVAERLAAFGAVVEDRFEGEAGPGINLILKLPGAEPRLDPLLVGAHFDGPPQSIGADDNASGVAALIELAHRWSADPPRRPVWVVGFDQEELGMVGSAALAQDLRRAGQALHLMVSLEMLGYTAEEQSYPVPGMASMYGRRGDFIALVANAAASWMLPALARGMGSHVKTKVLAVPNRGRPIPAVRLSDHSPFWDAGYNAVLVTDTSFLRNPHWHRMSDTVETLNLPFLAAVTEGVEAMVRGV